MLKKILVLLVLAVAVLFGYAATKPDDFRVSRSIKIAAPAEKLFEQVNNQRKWNDWSPWAKVDPNAKFSFEGPDAGVGSISRWEGNMEVGKGSSTITQSRPNEFIQFNLEFIEPMAGNDTAEFTFKPEGAETLVTWTMYGKQNLLAKTIGIVMNCEKMVGEQFDKGLASLKQVVEKTAAEKK